MNVKVTKAFIDKHTREFHDIGEVIEVTEERAKEILSAGEYIKEEKTEGQPEGQPEDKPLDKMTAEELKAFAKENDINISTAKNKAEILAILQENQK